MTTTTTTTTKRQIKTTTKNETTTTTTSPTSTTNKHAPRRTAAESRPAGGAVSSCNGTPSKGGGNASCALSDMARSVRDGRLFSCPFDGMVCDFGEPSPVEGEEGGPRASSWTICEAIARTGRRKSGGEEESWVGATRSSARGTHTHTHTHTLSLSRARSLSHALSLSLALFARSADIAVLYVMKEDLPSAEKFYNRALAIRLASLGESHPDTAQVSCSCSCSC